MDDHDDEYGHLDDSAIAALAQAEAQAQAKAKAKAKAEAHRSSITSSSVSAARPSASTAPPKPPQKEPIKQPTPQRIGRGGSSSVIVSPRQKGNPILSYIKNVPWEYGEIAADYQVGATAGALFLSLKYHKLHPDYIYTRIRNLAHAYDLRILLILVDITEHSDPLRELTKTSVVHNLTVILAWSSQEAGKYLETFKSFEHAPPTAIQEKVSSDYSARVVEVFTAIRSINKNDAMSLVTAFGSVRAAINARPEEVAILGGWGPSKVARFEKAVSEPFRVRKSTAAITASQRRRHERMEEELKSTRGTNPDVAMRLGIGSTVPSKANASPAAPPDWIDLDDDEDALLAAAEAEAEAETESRAVGSGRSVVREGSTRPTAPPVSTVSNSRITESVEDDDVGSSVMEALARMRERKR